MPIWKRTLRMLSKQMVTPGSPQRMSGNWRCFSADFRVERSRLPSPVDDVEFDCASVARQNALLSRETPSKRSSSRRDKLAETAMVPNARSAGPPHCLTGSETTMEQSSAIGTTAKSAAADYLTPDQPLGARFAEALGRKDFDAIFGLLDPQIDFRGLTPGRTWEATGADAVVDGILRQWFEDTDELEEIVSIESDGFADRERVSYRFRGHNSGGPFVVEQQAYYTDSEGRIDYMRVLCSGFRPR